MLHHDSEFVFCEVKPIYFGIFPKELSLKILFAEKNTDSDIKVALLGNTAPLWVKHPVKGYLPAIGYVSLNKTNYQRNWVPYSVGDTQQINYLWQEASTIIAQQNKSRSRGLTHIFDIDMNSYSSVEDFW